MTHAAGRPRDARGGVDGHRLHEREVDHHAVRRRPRGRRREWPPPRTETGSSRSRAKRSACLHVVGARAARDQRRPAVDRAVPDPPRLVVALLAGAQQRAAEAVRSSSARERRGRVGLGVGSRVVIGRHRLDAHAVPQPFLGAFRAERVLEDAAQAADLGRPRLRPLPVRQRPVGRGHAGPRVAGQRAGLDQDAQEQPVPRRARPARCAPRARRRGGRGRAPARCGRRARRRGRRAPRRRARPRPALVDRQQLAYGPAARASSRASRAISAAHRWTMRAGVRVPAGVGARRPRRRARAAASSVAAEQPQRVGEADPAGELGVLPVAQQVLGAVLGAPARRARPRGAAGPARQLARPVGGDGEHPLALDREHVVALALAACAQLLAGGARGVEVAARERGDGLRAHERRLGLDAEPCRPARRRARAPARGARSGSPPRRSAGRGAR